MRRLVLGVIAAALLGGCGGSDSEDGGKQQFVRRVDALCKDVNPKLTEINTAIIRARDAARAGQVGLPKTFETLATLLRRASATSDRFEDRLRAITPPAAERDFHGELLASVERGTANLRRQTSAAQQRDAVTLSKLSQRGSVLNTRSKGLLAGHGGFRVCGRG
jgi:hypothetical protein